MATIVCLHCSGSSARQWAKLAAALGPAHSVHAPNLIGYGGDGSWSAGNEVTLDAEAGRIEEIMTTAHGQLVLVGHSYGGAVATRIALRHPQRIVGLALFEPVLFSLILPGGDEAGREILATGNAIRDDVRDGRVERAAARFVDYWSGAGAWDALDRRRRDGVCSRMGKVAEDFRALFADPLPLAAYARLTMPVLLLEGETTPAPPRAVAARLMQVLPNATRARIAGAGHMGPITHAEDFNAAILRFVDAGNAGRRLGLAA
ncbi:MAG: alpha/beta fold hydrolase [Candidatus Levyibacteriota bacterium]